MHKKSEAASAIFPSVGSEKKTKRTFTKLVCILVMWFSSSVDKCHHWQANMQTMHKIVHCRMIRFTVEILCLNLLQRIRVRRCQKRKIEYYFWLIYLWWGVSSYFRTQKIHSERNNFRQAWNNEKSFEVPFIGWNKLINFKHSEKRSIWMYRCRVC